MNVLFIHQNFPGQFKHLAPALAGLGHGVTAMTMKPLDAAAPPPPPWQGVRLVPYRIARASTPGIHPWVADLETKTIRGEACFRAAGQLRQEGYAPDVVVAHPGWGESLFIKEVWPRTRLGIYCELYYQTAGADVGFDAEFPVRDAAADACRLRLRNANNLLHFEIADAGLSPTQWQAGSFPASFRSRITVAHDGIDTETVAPDPAARLTLGLRSGGTISLHRGDEVITFVARNLEPYRGYHRFMRALPGLLGRRPRARVLIVGGDEVSYGARPDPARHGAGSWKEIFIREVRANIKDDDWARVHFLGRLPYPGFLSVLQLSTVHVYLTYPFVLSWSLLEAMSAGCAIVASDTAPVREVVEHGQTGRLVDFFDGQALQDEICALLDDAPSRDRLGRQARAVAQARYDLETVCLPRQLQWVQGLRQAP